jgi:hypothetical protein
LSAKPQAAWLAVSRRCKISESRTMPNSFVRVLDAWAWQLGLLLILVLGVGGSLAIGHTVLGPLRKAARAGRQPMQFYLTDFVWLLVQLQATLGLVSAYVERNPAWAFYTVLAFLAFALTLMWWGALRALSQAGVKSAPRRAVLILVLLPGVEAAMVLAMLFSVVVSFGGYRELRSLLTRQSSFGSLAADLALMLLTAGAAVLATWLLRLLTLWLIAPTPAPERRAEISTSCRAGDR